MSGLVAERTISGSFGEVRDHNGVWLTNVQQIDFRITIERRDINVSGTRRTKYKAMGSSGEGSIRQLKVTSEWLKRVSEIMRSDTQQQFVGQLMVKLADPESLGTERVLLKNVKFWEISGGWQVNELVEEDIPFTFENISFPDEIRGDGLEPLARYVPLA